MIDEQVHINAELSNVPVKDLWIGCFEHNLFCWQFVHDLGDHIGPPVVHILRDALRLNHEALHSGFDELLTHSDQLLGV